MLDNNANTAVQAAEQLGCDVAQIAKSLVFRGMDSRSPLLVVASGSHRVDEEMVGKLVGEAIEHADARGVRELTGYAIGGVPPTGHLNSISTWIDRDLLAYETVWAAAGHPRSVIELPTRELVGLCRGTLASIH
jgi:prolyl-tRNA editing enzyme YbaK/EbsC (Cys-tRNA(Pro) deacylase)